MDVVIITCFDLLFRPDGGLHFADVGFAKEEHAEAALSDTSADGEGQAVFKQRLVEFQFLSFGATREIELARQSFLIHPDAHRGELEGTLQHLVPQDDIAIEAIEAVGVHAAPVVIVRGAPVVLLAVGQLPTDADDEDGAELLRRFGLPFTRGGARSGYMLSNSSE